MNRRLATGMLVLLAATTTPAGCSSTTAAPAPARTGNVSMPDLVGRNAAVAKDDLKRLGLGDNRIELSPRGHMFVAMPSHWTVTTQPEKPGAKVGLQELIVLTVVK